MGAARIRLKEFSTTRHAPLTISGYAMDWKDFAGWCASVGRPALPASEETVALYLSFLAPNRKVSTIERRMAAIAYRHEEAGYQSTTTRRIRAVIAGIRRANTKPIRQMAAMTVEELRTIATYLGTQDGKRALRDRAMIVLGFAGAFRRSELAALKLADIDLRDTRVTITLNRSKTDQQGRGRVLVIPKAGNQEVCAVRALRAWLAARGAWAGPLFPDMSGVDTVNRQPIAGVQVYYVLRSAAGRAGLDASRFGAHSLRAGAITAAADAGADVWEIMAMSGHKSVENVAKYVRRSVMRYPLRAVL